MKAVKDWQRVAGQQWALCLERIFVVSFYFLQHKTKTIKLLIYVRLAFLIISSVKLFASFRVYQRHCNLLTASFTFYLQLAFNCELTDS